MDWSIAETCSINSAGRNCKTFLTIVNTPQQNGHVERMNQMLLVRVRSMLISAVLPKEFWCEVVSIACHLINQTP